MSPVPLLAREREAFAAHRAALGRNGALRERDVAPRGTLLHGFLLPFSLVFAALRDPKLRRLTLRLTVVRLVALACLASFAIHAKPPATAEKRERPRNAFLVTLEPDAKTGEKREAVKVDLPGVHVDIDPARGTKDVVVAGKTVEVRARKNKHAAHEPSPEAVEADTNAKAPGRVEALFRKASADWAILVAVLGVLSALEAFLVFLSRKWDDQISFHISALSGVLPEDAEEPAPRLTFDLRWLGRKLLRRVRGYLVFAAGVPAFFPLLLVPSVGEWLFRLALTGWGWYWLGVFSASKSAHAWADGDAADAPTPIRALRDIDARARVFAPVRAYGRLWARLTRGVNPAASTFERSPAAFLGLALARAVLSLPGLYLLARPFIPVAAGRLAAEADPSGRFWAADEEATPAEPGTLHALDRSACWLPAPHSR